jgi:hypothetical protein
MSVTLDEPCRTRQPPFRTCHTFKVQILIPNAGSAHLRRLNAASQRHLARAQQLLAVDVQRATQAACE